MRVEINHFRGGDDLVHISGRMIQTNHRARKRKIGTSPLPQNPKCPLPPPKRRIFIVMEVFNPRRPSVAEVGSLTGYRKVSNPQGCHGVAACHHCGVCDDGYSCFFFSSSSSSSSSRAWIVIVIAALIAFLAIASYLVSLIIMCEREAAKTWETLHIGEQDMPQTEVILVQESPPLTKRERERERERVGVPMAYHDTREVCEPKATRSLCLRSHHQSQREEAYYACNLHFAA